jgi:hypothetical protein
LKNLLYMSKFSIPNFTWVNSCQTLGHSLRSHAVILDKGAAAYHLRKYLWMPSKSDVSLKQQRRRQSFINSARHLHLRLDVHTIAGAVRGAISGKVPVSSTSSMDRG